MVNESVITILNMLISGFGVISTFSEDVRKKKVDF
jgi:hypothetical protein